MTRDGDHVRDLIYEALLTNPGERVDRPDFGCGLRQLQLVPNSDGSAIATQHMVQTSLERLLGEVIRVDQVGVELDDSTITVKVTYRLIEDPYSTSWPSRRRSEAKRAQIGGADRHSQR